MRIADRAGNPVLQRKAADKGSASHLPTLDEHCVQSVYQLPGRTGLLGFHVLDGGRHSLSLRQVEKPLSEKHKYSSSYQSVLLYPIEGGLTSRKPQATTWGFGWN